MTNAAASISSSPPCGAATTFQATPRYWPAVADPRSMSAAGRAGWWPPLLLADGNIGIGGDPHRLLRRCRELVAPDGQVLVEVAAPGTRSWSGPVTIRPAAGPPSTPFRWASVALSDVPALATATALRILETWTEADRWFARIGPA